MHQGKEYSQQIMPFPWWPQVAACSPPLQRNRQKVIGIDGTGKKGMQDILWTSVLTQDSDEVRTLAMFESLWLDAAATSPRVEVLCWTEMLLWP